jgi:hypothetical protein
MYVPRDIVWNRNSKHQLGRTGRKDWLGEDCRSSRRTGLVAADLFPSYKFRISVEFVRSLLEILIVISYIWKSFARVSLELELAVDEPAVPISI